MLIVLRRSALALVFAGLGAAALRSWGKKTVPSNGQWVELRLGDGVAHD